VIVQIAAGGVHSLALFSDGSLYAWGANKYSQLGDGTNIDRNMPVKIGTGYTAITVGVNFALKGNILYALGGNGSGPVKIGTGYTAIAAGGSHILALKGDDLYAWGDNTYGQLGDGTGTNKNLPVLIGTGYTAIATGAYHSLALKGDALFVWGVNYTGQLGDGTIIDRVTPVQIGTGYTAIAAGYDHSLALKGNTLYAWGSNWAGQLGDGTNICRNSPVQIGTGYTAITAGSDHSLALKGSTLYTWGYNIMGQLGDGTYTTRYVPMQIGTGYITIAAGSGHSLALKGNILYAWGSNNSGQLGDGTSIERNIPIKVKFHSLSTLTPTPTPTPITNVLSITVAQTKVYLKKGSSATLSAVPVTGDNTAVKLTWKSSDQNTISITQTGKVKAHKAGSAIITAAADNGKSAKIDVIVGGKAAKSISIKNPPLSNTMTIGDELTLDIAAEPANAQGVFIFKSTNEKVVSVDAAGRLKALRKGSAFIVITVGVKAATLYLKVK